MNSTLKTTLIVTGTLVVAAVLVLAGLWIGRTGWGMTGYGPGMMTGNTAYGNGMMEGGNIINQGNMMGQGMMNGNDMMNQGNMMGSNMMQNGMMIGNSGLSAHPEPLSIEEAGQAVNNFLAAQENDDLALGEIMIFDNHAYAQIVEQSTGIGAMEVLVDPVTLAVAPEYGPNMMWNLKYGMMAGYGGGMMGMMMGGSTGMGTGMMGNTGNIPIQPGEISADLPVTPTEAVESAQRYLDTYLPGTQVDDHADAFYGYYTLHILREGKVVGMLSVNGYTRQVLLHTWHGELLEMGVE